MRGEISLTVLRSSVAVTLLIHLFGITVLLVTRSVHIPETHAHISVRTSSWKNSNERSDIKRHGSNISPPMQFRDLANRNAVTISYWDPLNVRFPLCVLQTAVCENLPLEGAAIWQAL